MEKKIFEVKIRYNKPSERQTLKKTTESFVVDAVSFTEAEARIIEAMRGYVINGHLLGDSIIKDIEVIGETITKYARVYPSADPDATKFFKVRHSYVFFDDHGNEKKTPEYLLIQADSNDQARCRYEEIMRQEKAMDDIELEEIASTKIVSYFPHE